MDKVINVTRSSMPAFEEYIEEIRDIWDTRVLTNGGRKHVELERELCEYLGCENVKLFTNGHLALETALDVLELSGEVITTPFTFASTTQALVRRGLTPVFCDVEPSCYTLDADKIEPLITERTCAILPVHVYGNLCDDEKISALAKKHGLKVIYDAAHTFGIKNEGKPVAKMGDITMYSFHATKVFNTIEGGALCFSDGELGGKVESLKDFGLHGFDGALVGGNAKMTEFQAAMGLCNLRHMDEYIAGRAAAEACYRERLEGVGGIQLCPAQKGVTPNCAYFPVVFDGFKRDRDEVFGILAESGINARKYFYPLTSTFPAYAERFEIQSTPIAARVAERVLCLPMYSELSPDDANRICDIILK